MGTLDAVFNFFKIKKKKDNKANNRVFHDKKQTTIDEKDIGSKFKQVIKKELYEIVNCIPYLVKRALILKSDLKLLNDTEKKMKKELEKYTTRWDFGADALSSFGGDYAASGETLKMINSWEKINKMSKSEDEFMGYEMTTKNKKLIELAKEVGLGISYGTELTFTLHGILEKLKTSFDAPTLEITTKHLFTTDAFMSELTKKFSEVRITKK